LLEVLTYLLN